MKKEAREKAEKMYLKAAGKITNREIATAVDVNALTVGRWKRDGNWEKKLKKLAKAAKPAAPVVRKKAARDKAFKLYVDSGGSVTNKELARRVGVSPATISKWKELDNWPDQLVPEPVPMAAPEPPEGVEEAELDMNELAAPEQIIQINRRIDALLRREHLSASEVANLAEAKSGLLEGVEVYLAIVQQVKDLKSD